ncbi:hypothetical protein [Pyxidicoccus caerfyrddinensis]|uniref:hypothetical protein n=1 Tax=Pyxidicoccus caerfyrddinensis TaxID=2709663 RepID=UPI0013DAB6AF|nr:hypothetical protein [Pyxidicoccus caerfyrddinensis]
MPRDVRRGMDAPEERESLWVGDISGVRWEVWLTGIYEGPLTDPATGELLEGTHSVSWDLEVISSEGERLTLWWEPSSRTLGGDPLRGWGGNVIGALKRHLLRVGRQRG